MPKTAVVVGGPLVKAGTWLTEMLKFCVVVPAALEAVTVPVYAPATDGVPVMAPAVLRLSPVGRLPAVTAKVGVGEPVAV